MSDIKPTKQTYRIRNWAEYNAAWIQRGSFTWWLDEALIKRWYNTEKSGRRGASNTYSEVAIQCALTLTAVYRWPLRTTPGLLNSWLALVQVPLTPPHYSTCCCRQQTVDVCIPRTPSTEARHLVVDSPGLKVFGEGEWKVRQHGYSKRRTWRKLQVAVDEATHEIVATLTTTHAVGDSEVLPEWLDQVPEPIDPVSADGSYDSRDCQAAIAQRQARAAIPPREMPSPGSRILMAPCIRARRFWSASARWAWRHGKRRVVIISAVWPRRPCSGSRPCSALSSKRAALTPRSLRPTFAVRL
jgi:hypothetical protein